MTTREKNERVKYLRTGKLEMLQLSTDYNALLIKKSVQMRMRRIRKALVTFFSQLIFLLRKSCPYASWVDETHGNKKTLLFSGVSISGYLIMHLYDDLQISTI